MKVRLITRTRTPIAVLATRATELAEDIEEFKTLTILFQGREVRVSDLLDALAEREHELEGVRNQIKDLARQRAVPGQRVQVLRSAAVTVYVDGRQKPEQYDNDAAMTAWGEATFHRVSQTVVDYKAVRQLVEDGVLTEEQVRKAQLPREPDTPAVTIKGL